MIDYQRVAQAVHERSLSALCIVTHTSGSTPQKAGARMLVHSDGSEFGRIEGTIGGGAIEHKIRLEALAAIRESIPRQIRISLTHELGMCCGGQMTVYIEPLSCKSPLFIFGAGHVGEALARIAAQVGFEISVADPRKDLLKEERLPYAARLICNYTAYELDQMSFDLNTSIVIATHDHQLDQMLVEEILHRPFRYAALIASKRKAMLTKERCLAKGIAAKAVARLHAPAGLSIGAQTPAEIAISVVAEMLQEKRRENSSTHCGSRLELADENIESIA